MLAYSTGLFLIFSCAVGNPIIAEASHGKFSFWLCSWEVRLRHDALLPLRWLVRALSHPLLYPLASVSYTGYLLQGIAMNACLVLGWAGEGLNWWLFPGVLLVNSLLGLVLSLLVERPAMNLLNMVAPG